MSENEEICEPNSKLDNWVRLVAGLVLIAVVVGNMMGLFVHDAPIWFKALLVALAAGIEAPAIRRIIMDIIQKQFAKK
ncbi:MAG: hypothetical protein COA84_15050 [Robiginitomaculum sp.]|nr:MAG: hypothetical protein COA84_15050 [Robiginitomaculum sp.]